MRRRKIGVANGAVLIDGSSVVMQSDDSVGVARQRCGSDPHWQAARLAGAAQPEAQPPHPFHIAKAWGDQPLSRRGCLC